MSRSLTIHTAGQADKPIVDRLAALDSTVTPAGPLLIATADGEPVAAISLRDGTVIADPFRPTATVEAILREYRAGLAGPPPARRRRPARSPWHAVRLLTPRLRASS